ncbi:MAG: murein hydrolase activator EnvC family protein [Eubacteriaceae bacterium]
MIKKKMVAGALTSVIAFGMIITPVSANSLQDQLAESNAKKTEAQFQVEVKQSTIADIETQLVRINEEVNRITGVIDALNGEIAVLEANIAKTQKELEVAETKRLEQEAAMDERVRTMYMYGNSSMLEFLFTATDFSDFVTKIDMSRYIIESDKEALKAIEETKRVIDEKKQSIEADRLKTVEKKTAQETALVEQRQVKAQKDQLLAENQALVEEYQRIVAAETSNAAGIEAQVRELMAQQGSAGGIGGGSTTGGSGTFVPSSGTYQWPLPGYGPRESDDYFGTRLHPIWGDYRTHYGVDMSAPGGTPLLAMGNGKVISAGYNGGYGNCVIIDLGNGLQAMYAHMSSFSVSPGETVNKGDVIGGVGSTGDSTGNHLHFGVLSGGSFVDPLGFF